MPQDGGVYVPSSIEDLRRWIYYIDEKTTFTSIAGTITSALINDEFSPIICESIATQAFPFKPEVKQLDEKLFMMDLYTGYTGCHRDFGVSYLCSYLEKTLQLQGGQALILDYTDGELGSLLARVLKNKKHIKAVLVYQKGRVTGLSESDLFWNGGNIYPVEMQGSEDYIKEQISAIFKEDDFVKKHAITVSNTTNVCRLLGQIFFFPYSFAQIKNKVDSDIYYALDSGNYATLMAGLYSWRFALPVSGFFVPSTSSLCADINGSPVMLDEYTQNKQDDFATPINPANLERLKSFFNQNQLMMRNFVYPVNVNDKQRELAAKELYTKYKVFADPETARAYAAIREKADSVYADEGSIVLMAYNHPSLSADYCRHVTGRTPDMPENIREAIKPFKMTEPVISGAEELKKIIQKIK